jgi:hypothetical protein
MPRMYALRADGERGRLLVEGVVSRRTSLLPDASLDYKAFAKKRQIQHHRSVPFPSLPCVGLGPWALAVGGWDGMGWDGMAWHGTG